MNHHVLILLTLAAVLAGCTSPRSPTAATLQVPTLTVGDFWSESATVDGTPAEAANWTRVVAAIEDLNVDGTTYRTYRETVTGAQVQGTQWLRTSDLALVRVEIHDDDFPSSLTYTPPCGIRWPLRAHAQWTSTCVETFKLDDPDTPDSAQQNRTQAYRVENKETVTTPAGSFETLKFTVATTDESGSTDEVQWWSSRACGAVRMTETTSGQTTTITLTSFRCAKGS